MSSVCITWVINIFCGSIFWNEIPFLTAKAICEIQNSIYSPIVHRPSSIPFGQPIYPRPLFNKIFALLFSYLPQKDTSTNSSAHSTADHTVYNSVRRAVKNRLYAGQSGLSGGLAQMRASSKGRRPGTIRSIAPTKRFLTFHPSCPSRTSR